MREPWKVFIKEWCKEHSVEEDGHPYEELYEKVCKDFFDWLVKREYIIL